MQGIIRFVLAYLVVVSHLGGHIGGIGSLTHLGLYAVFCFYLLSGYVITSALHGVYAFRFAPFAINRFLRLFPAYYLVALATLAAILIFPDQAAHLQPAWAVQDRPIDVAGNALLFPFVFYDKAFRLVPPTWSIGVEIVCYFLLWLVIARNVVTAFGVVIIAAAYHVVSLWTGAPFWDRYIPVTAALLPFSLGAAIYFLRESQSIITRIATGRSGLFLALWIGNMLVARHFGVTLNENGSRAFEAFYYSNLALMFFFMLAISVPSYCDPLAKIGAAIGPLSYPMFLVHWLIGLLVTVTVGQSPDVVIYATPLVIVAAWLITKLSDAMIEPIRNRIRSGQAIGGNVKYMPSATAFKDAASEADPVAPASM